MNKSGFFKLRSWGPDLRRDWGLDKIYNDYRFLWPVNIGEYHAKADRGCPAHWTARDLATTRESNNLRKESSVNMGMTIELNHPKIRCAL